MSSGNSKCCFACCSCFNCCAWCACCACGACCACCACCHNAFGCRPCKRWFQAFSTKSFGCPRATSFTASRALEGLRNCVRDACLALLPGLGPGLRAAEGCSSGVVTNSLLTGAAGSGDALLGRPSRDDCIPRLPGAAWPKMGASINLYIDWLLAYTVWLVTCMLQCASSLTGQTVATRRLPLAQLPNTGVLMQTEHVIHAAFSRQAHLDDASCVV